MEDWKEYKLGDIAKVKGGKRLPKGSNLTTIPNTHPYIRVRELGTKKTLELDPSYEYVDDETQKKIAKYIVNEGDIIISIVGTIGLVAIIGHSLNNANLTENCVKLIDVKDIDREYLYYYLVSDKGKNEIEKGVVGAVQAKLPIKNIQVIKIKAPDFISQKRIASILSTLDSKIECSRRINENLELQAQALFEKIIMYEKFPRTKVLNDYAFINPSRSLSKGTTARYIDMSSLPTKGSFPSDWTFKDYNGGMKFQNEDTIMARITPCLENGKTAYINFLDENEIAFGSTEYIVLSPRDGFCPELLYFLARHDDFVSYAVAHMNGSSGRQRVSGNDIANYIMPDIPSENIIAFGNEAHVIV